MSKKRAQSAMEHIMTYSWSLLVIMVVGVVLWRMGIFSGGVETHTSTGFARLKPQLVATSMKVDGNFTTVFTNGAGAMIDVKYIFVNNTEKGVTCEPVPAGSPIQSIGAGELFIINSPSCGAGIPEDMYNVRIHINYTIISGSLEFNHIDSGTIKGPYEPV